MSSVERERSETSLVTIDALVERFRAGGLRYAPVAVSASAEESLRAVLLRGVPAGVLVVWEHPAPATRRHVGDATIGFPARDDAWWVIEGAEWLDVLLRGAGEELRDVEIQIPVHVLRTPAEDTLREVYRHLQTRPGRQIAPMPQLPLRRSESVKTIADIAETLRDRDFGSLEPEVVARCVTAILGEDQGAPQAGMLSREVPPALHDRCVDAIGRAIVFLQSRVGLPHIALLPYNLHLVVLSRFFALHPDPHPRSGILLARWFWRDVVANHEDRGAAMAIRRMQHCVDDDEHASVQALLRTGQHVTPGKERAWAAIRRSKKILAVILASLGPRNLMDDTTLDLERHFVLPARDWFVKLDGTMSGSAVSTLLLHPRMSSAELERAIAHAPAEALRSHMFPDEAVRALTHGKRARAIALRESALREDALEFLNRRAAWDAEDRPPIDALLVADAHP